MLWGQATPSPSKTRSWLAAEDTWECSHCPFLWDLIFLKLSLIRTRKKGLEGNLCGLVFLKPIVCHPSALNLMCLLREEKDLKRQRRGEGTDQAEHMLLEWKNCHPLMTFFPKLSIWNHTLVPGEPCRSTLRTCNQGDMSDGLLCWICSESHSGVTLA